VDTKLPGKLRQAAAFCAGAAAATLLADALLIAFSGAMPPRQAIAHHVEFLVTLMVLVGLSGAMALQLPPACALEPRALLLSGALAAVIGYAIGVLLAPALGATASIVAIALAAAAVPRVAAHRARRAQPR
jgi:hypothetical protein